MLSLPKHLYRVSNSFTIAVEMLRQAQHDVLFSSAPYSGTLNPKAQMACNDPKTWVARPWRSSPKYVLV